MDIQELEIKQMKRRKVMVGALFALAGAFALVFAYWMGVFGGFGPSKSFYVTYDFAGGVDRGSPVRLAGIKVGRVTDIGFADGESGKLVLKIQVNNTAIKQITEDSRFYINLAGLIGERYVEIVSGTGSPIKSGHKFRGIDPPRVDQLISQGYGIFGDMRKFFEENKTDMKELLVALNNLAKSLNELFANATPEQRKQLSAMMENFSVMSGDLRKTMKLVREGTEHISAKGGKQAWNNFSGLMEKGNAIELNDIRRLMLDDGMKVNFGRTGIPEKTQLPKEALKK